MTVRRDRTSGLSDRRPLSNSEVAKEVGVDPARLGQWLTTGKVERPKMSVVDGRIVFWWTEADIERVRAYSVRISRRQGAKAYGH